ncbi:PepSY-associated TM helix domain-containing protein [Crossiella cryophila]|uniref:Putative iron-regulated membrane protein n=1 Tax=Crossiella cryophila TaxID=43355 RepID=A0A7W7CEZ4_9PSEU|nr:PepSY domain-containing protein [Crossiella cryophila]MBB4679931.1 putative iron-regulated membrane protein [Crossiella cryophila]
MTANQLTATTPAPPASQSRTLRPLLLRLHFYAGVLIGPFLLIAAFTGLLYVFTPQLERVVHSQELFVTPAGAPQPLSQQITAAKAALPGATLVRVRPGATETDSTQIIFSRADLAPSHWLTAYVDPYTAQVRGTLETYGSSQATPIRTWLDELHRSLHLGDIGRLYSELAASWLWLVVLGGLILWWQRQRARRRRLLLVDRKLRGRRGLLSWHAVLGTWIALPLLFLSVTGLTWSEYGGESIAALRKALSWQTPTLSTSLSEHSAHGSHQQPTGTPGPDIGPDRVLATARQSGLDGPVEITLPAGAGKAYLVKQIKGSWPQKQDAMAVDPATAQPLETLRFQDFPLGAKLARWGIDGHMGVLFGLPNQLLLAAVCLTLITMILLGYRMWWHRRPTRDRFALGRPFPRGGWRAVHPVALAGLAVAAVLVMWQLPVFGVSLLGFLAVDLVLAWRARRRRALVVGGEELMRK